MRPIETLTDAQGTYQVHRPWFKVLLNPILRLTGFHLVSFFTDDDHFVGYRLLPCSPSSSPPSA